MAYRPNTVLFSQAGLWKRCKKNRERFLAAEKGGRLADIKWKYYPNSFTNDTINLNKGACMVFKTTSEFQMMITVD